MKKIVVYPILVTALSFLLIYAYLYNTTTPSDETHQVSMNQMLIQSVLISSLLGLMLAGYIHVYHPQIIPSQKMKFKLK
jgi:hypothetical protein